MFSLPPPREVPGLFAFDEPDADAEAELEAELAFWSREQLDALQRAVAAGLDRYPWAAAQRIAGKSPLEIARLVLRLDEATYSTDLPPSKRVREAVEMPRIWNTTIEDKRFPSDLRAEGPVVANTESDVLIEDAVKDVMRKPVLGQKLRLHPAFMSTVHDVLLSYVKQVAALAALVCNERRRNRGFHPMFETDNVTAADVRLASIILMNEDPVLEEEAVEQPDSAAQATSHQPATPSQQSVTLSTNEDLSI